MACGERKKIRFIVVTVVTKIKKQETWKKVCDFLYCMLILDTPSIISLKWSI